MPRHTDPLPWTAMVLFGFLSALVVSGGFYLLAEAISHLREFP